MIPEHIRFTTKVDKTESCWNWTGAKYRGGYGHFRRKVNGKWKMYKAHRYSYEYFHGPITEGLIVLHTCDNPSCVNPSHLRQGTFKENSQEMVQKGRKKHGFKPNCINLNRNFAENVRQYRKDFPFMLNKEIAEVFDISAAQCSRILSNQIWK